MSAIPSSAHDPERISSRLPANVWVLGAVAFFNDTATEMSYWLLPQFLVGVLGAGPLVFGLIEGAAETIASVGRLLSGVISDRLRRRKPLAALGYTVANLAKPLLALAQSWGQVFWIRFADRAAKGFRAAPRDALIADSVPPEKRGAAFGLRQAMDSAGAIAGPLSAILLLSLLQGKVRLVFWAATVPGLVSVLLVWLAVREVRPAPREKVKGSASGASWEMPRGLFFILLALAVFSLGNSSDLFLILRAQNLGVSPALAPALGLIFNSVYTVMSWPAGRLSDRVPRRALVMAGFLVYALVYLGFARARSARVVWLLFPPYGLYYAMTEGVLKAWIADLVPNRSLASVYGLFNWIVGVAAFPASLLAGWLWRTYSPATPFYLSAALSFAATGFLLLA
jgi:MFS family permease